MKAYLWQDVFFLYCNAVCKCELRSDRISAKGGGIPYWIGPYGGDVRISGNRTGDGKKDVSLYEAKQYKDQIEAVDGVDQVLWCDAAVNIYAGEDFISMDDIEDYYKDRCAVMDITFDEGDTAKRTSRAVDEIRDLLGEKGCYTGMAVQNKSLKENIESEMQLIMLVAVIMILRSYVLPRPPGPNRSCF